MNDIQIKLQNAVIEGSIVKFKDKITTKTITQKLKNPINIYSPISLSVKNEEEWLRGCSHGWAKTIGGTYLEEVVAAVAPIAGWSVRKIGNKIDLENTNTKQTVMLKTQPSTANQSATMGDNQKAGQASQTGYTSYNIIFFKPNHENIIQTVFGYTKSDIEGIKQFLVNEFHEARTEYEKQLKSHPLYNHVVRHLADTLKW